jgi:endonuclease V-like protein UPF0215 family
VQHTNVRYVKPEIRIVGIDDGVFTPHTRGKCDVIGVVFRGGYWLDGVMRTQVEIDGLDATGKIAQMILHSPHYRQLRVVMLDGVTFAGFNVVDTLKLCGLTHLPVIAVTREQPDFTDIREALENLPSTEERWKAIKEADRVVRVVTHPGEKAIFMQVSGLHVNVARRIVRNTATRSNIPEPLRVAHLVASGVTRPLYGES